MLWIMQLCPTKLDKVCLLKDIEKLDCTDFRMKKRRRVRWELLGNRKRRQSDNLQQTLKPKKKGLKEKIKKKKTNNILRSLKVL